MVAAYTGVRTWPPPHGGNPVAVHWRSIDPATPVPMLMPGWAEAVMNLRGLVRDLDHARRLERLTVTALAERAEVPMSTTKDLLDGAAWPRATTLARLGAALGRRLRPSVKSRAVRAAAGLAVVWVPPLPDGWAVGPLSEPAYPLVAAPWRVEAILAQLNWLRLAQDVSGADWARAAQVRAATVCELTGPHPTRHDVNFAVLAGLARGASARLAWEDATTAYRPVWQAVARQAPQPATHAR